MSTIAPRQFDHQSPVLAASLHETLAEMREREPVAWSDEHGGFWVVTRYEDVLRVAQDWRTFSSAEGVGVPVPGVVTVLGAATVDGGEAARVQAASTTSPRAATSHRSTTGRRPALMITPSVEHVAVAGR